MEMIVINGVITTVGPLSITMPKPEHMGGDAFKAFQAVNGFPMMTRGVDADGKPEKTGYLPGTTLRGYLRRAVVLRAMRAAAARGDHYSLPDAYRDLIGQDSESEKQAGDINLDAIRSMREGSPIVDLFGTGLAVQSRLRVGHFTPAKNILPEPFSGVRKDLEDTEGILEFLSEADQATYRDRSAANTRRAVAERSLKSAQDKQREAKRRSEDTAELDAAVKAAEKVMAAHKEDMGGMAVSTKMITGYMALGAGLALHGRLAVVRAQERDLEMIEYGLDCLSRDPVLGAQTARGCGEVEGRFVVEIDGEEVKVIEVGGYKPARVTALR